MEPKPTITIGPSIWAYTGHFVIIREPPGIWAGDICRAVETEEDAAPWHGVLVRVVLSQAACAAASQGPRNPESARGCRSARSNHARLRGRREQVRPRAAGSSRMARAATARRSS